MPKTPRIYDYDSPKSEPHLINAKNINPYLVDAADLLINTRTNPLSNVPKIKFGNQPIDGGFLILDRDERNELIQNCPEASILIRPFLGAVEFINGGERYCLWLKDISPTLIKSIPEVVRRLDAVRKFRLESLREATRDLAATPSLFAFISHEERSYVVIPSVSSERRNIIPIGFLPKEIIVSNLCLLIPGANIFHFGVLTSTMHMAWVRAVCGRLKSDYRYSNGIVYNNFPWPISPNENIKQAIENAAQAVLDTRAQFPDSTLADLYDPLTIPPVLVKAHQALDRAVDAAYGKTNFKTEAERVAFLFERYQEITSLLPVEKAAKRKSPKRKDDGTNAA